MDITPGQPRATGVAHLAPGRVVRRGALWGAFAHLPAALGVALVAAFGLAPQALATVLRAIAAEPSSVVLLYLLAGFGHCLAFAWHAARNPRLPGAQRARWAVAMLLASGVAAPLYWWQGLAATMD